MGASEFYTFGTGTNIEMAFCDAQDRARADQDGDSDGYDGDVTTKDRFVVIALPAGKTARSYAEELIDAHDSRIDDKYGPAGAIQVNANTWLFFGWGRS
jgi:hypothetical protein